MSQITYPVTFDGFNLATVSGLTVLSTNPYMPPARHLNANQLARTDRQKVEAAFYETRDIVVRVGIAQATRNLMEQALDSLMQMLQGIEKELVLPQSGGSRKYICTYGDSVIYEAGGSYLEMELIFVCSDRFGYDINPTLLLQITGFTSGNKTDQLIIGGSAPWQVPVITYTYSVVTTGTNATVTVGNGATGQSVAVTRNWIAGDVLTIDSYNKTVKVNGAEVDFTGAIPEWQPGVGYITYADTFSARTFSGQVVYNRRWT